MSTTLNRLISYGMVLGLGIVALAVLLFATRPGTNDEAAIAPGLGVAPRYAVLGEVAAPQGDIPVTCPSTEFVANASGQNTTPKPSPTPEPTPVPATWLLPPPCVHALAWVAAPSAPASFPNTDADPGQ